MGVYWEWSELTFTDKLPNLFTATESVLFIYLFFVVLVKWHEAFSVLYLLHIICEYFCVSITFNILQFPMLHFQIVRSVCILYCFAASCRSVDGIHLWMLWPASVQWHARLLVVMPLREKNTRGMPAYSSWDMESVTFVVVNYLLIGIIC